MGSGRAAFVAATDPLRRVTLDTSAWVRYLTNEPEGHAGLVAHLLVRCVEGRLEIEIPGIVELELLVLPYKSRDSAHIARIRRLTREHPGITTSPITERMMHVAAEIRALTSFKVPDALVAASAILNGSAAVIGNDKDFRALDAIKNVHMMARGRRPLTIPPFLRLDDYSD